MIGTVACGRFTDLIGRRGTIKVANLLFLIGWLAIASAKVPVYIREISPKSLRGGFASAVLLLLSLGTALMFFVGSLVTWRTLALIDAGVCVLQLTVLMFIPELPRWLAKIGREKELEATLQCLRGEDVDISEEAAMITGYTKAFEQLFQEAGILDLFKWRYAHALFAAVGLMLLQQFGGVFAVSTYASQIFVTAGSSRRMGNLAMGILQASSAGMCLNGFVIAVSFVMQDHCLLKEMSPFLVLIGIMGYKRIICCRHVRHPVDYHVRDIPHQHGRISW